MFCFKDRDVPLEKCVFSTPNWNPSNIITHLRKQHGRESVPELFIEEEKKVNAIKVEQSKSMLSTVKMMIT